MDIPVISHGIAQKEFTSGLYFSAPEFSLYLNKSNPYDMSLALNLT